MLCSGNSKRQQGIFYEFLLHTRDSRYRFSEGRTEHFFQKNESFIFFLASQVGPARAQMAVEISKFFDC